MSAGNRMIELGRVLATSITQTARAILANIGSLGDDDAGEQGDVANDQPLFTHPVYCRPLGRVKEEDATPLNPAGVCESVIIRSADEVYPIGYRDLRLSRLVNPIEGEVGIVGYQGGFISLRPNADGDGTNFLLYGARRGPDGEVEAASSIAIDSTSSQRQILIQHELGQTIVLNKDGGVVMANAANDAWLEVNESGISLNGNTAITGAVREVTVGNPATAQGLMMSVDQLLWVSQVNTALGQITSLLTQIKFAIGQIAGILTSVTPGTPVVTLPIGSITPPVGAVTQPSATPKASTIAKASENAV